MTRNQKNKSPTASKWTNRICKICKESSHLYKNPYWPIEWANNPFYIWEWVKNSDIFPTTKTTIKWTSSLSPRNKWKKKNLTISYRTSSKPSKAIIPTKPSKAGNLRMTPLDLIEKPKTINIWTFLLFRFASWFFTYHT